MAWYRCGANASSGGGNGLSCIPGKVINGNQYYDAADAIKSNPI